MPEVAKAKVDELKEAKTTSDLKKVTDGLSPKEVKKLLRLIKNQEDSLIGK